MVFSFFSLPLISFLYARDNKPLTTIVASVPARVIPGEQSFPCQEPSFVVKTAAARCEAASNKKSIRCCEIEVCPARLVIGVPRLARCARKETFPASLANRETSACLFPLGGKRIFFLRFYCCRGLLPIVDYRVDN